VAVKNMADVDQDIPTNGVAKLINKAWYWNHNPRIMIQTLLVPYLIIKAGTLVPTAIAEGAGLQAVERLSQPAWVAGALAVAVIANRAAKVRAANDQSQTLDTDVLAKNSNSKVIKLLRKFPKRLLKVIQVAQQLFVLGIVGLIIFKSVPALGLAATGMALVTWAGGLFRGVGPLIKSQLADRYNTKLKEYFGEELYNSKLVVKAAEKGSNPIEKLKSMFSRSSNAASPELVVWKPETTVAEAQVVADLGTPLKDDALVEQLNAEGGPAIVEEQSAAAGTVGDPAITIPADEEVAATAPASAASEVNHKFGGKGPGGGPTTISDDDAALDSLMVVGAGSPKSLIPRSMPRVY